MQNAQLVDDFALLANPNNQRVAFNLPNDAAIWRAGVYELSLIMDDENGDPIESNKLTLIIAPQFTTFNATRNPDNTINVDITVNPQVHDTQSVSMILGQHQQNAQALSLPVTDDVSFIFPDIASGDYWVRVRVDGIDSLLIDRSQTPPVFFPTQEVTIPA